MLLEKQDSEIAALIAAETRRQNDGLELIPSENYASKAVLEALGNAFANKYSEGYPHKRYYGGQQCVDEMEDLCIARARALFDAEHVNVQPLSGSPANHAVFFALLQYKERFMGMDLAQGGHLTHGSPVNYSGIQYSPIAFGVDRETEMLDYDAIRKQAVAEKPKLIVSGFTAYPRKIDFRAFREICDEVGALCMADISHIAGLCIGGEHENPVPYFDVVTTTTHKTLRGPRGAIIMCREQYAKAIDKAVFPGLQGGPHDHVQAAKAVAFKEASQPSFKAYAMQIVKNSKALADELLAQGFRLVSGGTDNHLLLVDLRNKDVTGKEAEAALDECGLTVNKNTIPFDPRKPFDPSGIRLGTPAATTRGMKEGEMHEIGKFIARTIAAKDDAALKQKIRAEVKELCGGFPVY
ncbi:MAG: serine hydroxymethyltransferase [Candidatus Micrarchaeota archaeon]